MESAACRRRASDAEQSARWTYSATAECEPVTVKEEPEGGECGVSEAAVAGLYAGHEVKDEVVIGPETVQQQDVAFSMQKNMEYTIRNDHTYSKKPHCDHTYVKLKQESQFFLRNEVALYIRRKAFSLTANVHLKLA
ncbi:uncharacterized protein isoform X2 [Choristoneura fumiferana]|uniref:uncharacterized protein isoform X2 n=1 Tax=Choristoneura fumiferana TaxID=7141 RepID=UPI003D1580F8